MDVKVRLNGTEENPFLKYGVKQNPFPQIGKYEYAAANQLLANLAAEPIKDEDDLRKRLDGCSEEFVELCVRHYKPGCFREFTVSFPD